MSPKYSISSETNCLVQVVFSVLYLRDSLVYPCTMLLFCLEVDILQPILLNIIDKLSY